MLVFSSKILITAFFWLWTRPRGWRHLWKWPVYILLTPYIAIRYRHDLLDALEKIDKELMYYGIPPEFHDEIQKSYQEQLDNCSDDDSGDEFGIDELDDEYYVEDVILGEEVIYFPEGVQFVDGGIMTGNRPKKFEGFEPQGFPLYWYRGGTLYTANADAKAHSPELPDAATIAPPDKLARAVAELTHPSSS